MLHNLFQTLTYTVIYIENMKKILLFLFLMPSLALNAQNATCPSCTQEGTNLVTNGDFSGGNSGFTTNLIYSIGTSSPGRYAIRTNSNTFWIGGCSTPDHTPGGGTSMLCVDARTTGITIGWAQTIDSLEQNRDYIFTFYTKFAVCSSSPFVPSLQILINATQLGDTVIVRNGPWRKCSYVWNSGSATSAVIQIVDTVPGGSGNDFLLDDISFTRCDTSVFVDAGPNDEVCTGSSIQLNSTGTGSGTCSWSGPAGLDNYNICNPSFIPASAGNYTFTVDYTLGNCTISDSLTITANPLPPTPDIYRSGDTLFTSPAPFYQWYSTSGVIPGETGSFLLPSSAGSYFVMAIDPKGCMSSSDTLLFTPCDQLFYVDGGPDHIICEGNPVQLNAVSTGPGNCFWDAPAGLDSYTICNPVYDGAAPGTWLFIVLDTMNGCWQRDSVYITVNPLPSKPTITRSGDSLTSSPAASYQWYFEGNQLPGETAQLLLAVQAGYYHVVTFSPDTCGNSSDSVYFIPCSALLTVSAVGDTSVCAGSPVPLSVVTSGTGSCTWTGPPGLSSYTICNPVFTSLIPGDYLYEVTDYLNGCTSTDTVIIHVDALPPQPLITQSGDTLFSDAPAGNQWYFEGNILNGETNEYHVAAQQGSYTVTVTDFKGCQSSSDPYNFIPCSQVLIIEATGDTSVCEGEIVSLSVSGNGGGSCSWTGPTGLDDYNSCNPVFTPATHGDFMFEVTVTLSGCTAKDTVYIHVDSLPDQPAITVSNDTLLSPAADSYQWYDAGGAIPGETNQFLVATPGIYYYVVVTNVAGCTAVSDSAAYNPCSPPFTITVMNDTSLCTGSSIILTTSGTGPGNCLWTGPPGLDNYETCNPVFTGLIDGDFTFILYDTIAGCFASDTIEIHVNVTPGHPVISLAGDTFYSTPESSYQWHSGGNAIAGENNQFLLPSPNTWYYVSVTNASGCTAVSDSVFYSACSIPFTITAMNDTSACEGESIILTTTGDGPCNCTWSGPPGLDNYNICNPVFTALAPGDYTYIVTDTSAGCQASDTIFIHVDSLPSKPVVIISNDTVYSSPALSYQWYSMGSIISGETGPFVVAQPDNWYYVSVTNAEGCASVSDSVYYSSCSSPFTISTINDTIICAGSPFSLTVSGGPGNCSWSGPSGLDNYFTCSPVFIGLSAGYQTFVVTDTLLGCTATDTVVILVDAPPAPVISQSGDSLYSSTATSYQWNTSGALMTGEINPYLVPPVSNAYYYVMVSNAAGCTANSDSILYLPCSLAVNLTTIPDTIVCAGTPVTLITNGNGNGNCVWNGPPGLDNYNTCQPVFSSLFGGDYFFLVYDEYNSCFGYDSVNIHVLDAPVAPVITQQNDSLVTIPGPYYYQWYSAGEPLAGENFYFMIPYMNGYYSVMITDMNGCQALSDSIAPGFTSAGAHSETGHIGIQHVNGSEYISILNNSNNAAKLSVSLYDVQGRSILDKVQPVQAHSELRLYPGDLRPGAYIVRVTSGAMHLNKKIVYTGR